MQIQIKRKIFHLIAWILLGQATVFAQQAAVTDSAVSDNLYRKKGTASFYANKFVGRRTANGEIFSQKKLTAAHRTLPFNTLVKVTNPKNGRWVIVRINDRGPKPKKRIIDLTFRAASHLGMVKTGTMKVLVEEVPKPKKLDIQPLINEELNSGP